MCIGGSGEEGMWESVSRYGIWLLGPRYLVSGVAQPQSLQVCNDEVSEINICMQGRMYKNWFSTVCKHAANTVSQNIIIQGVSFLGFTHHLFVYGNWMQ